jgi:hypothetical protein
VSGPAREGEWLRCQIACLRARTCELQPTPTREQVKEALRAQKAGSTLRGAHPNTLPRPRALYRAANERRRWEWRVKEFGPDPHRAGPEP